MSLLSTHAYTVDRTLPRYEAELRRPAEEAAESSEAARVAAEAEQDRLTSEVAKLTAWQRERKEAETAENVRRSEVRRKAQRVTGHVGAGLVIMVFVVLGLTGIIHGRITWATSCVVVVLVATSLWAWGVRRSIRTTAWQAILGVGAATALWFGVFSAVPDAKPSYTVLRW